MDTDINWIETYINSLHSEEPKTNQPNAEATVQPSTTESSSSTTKISLDVSILQQRMDSVSVVKYYKDLKNDRLKLNERIKIMDDEQLFQDMQAHDNSKPWNKQDKYTKIKRMNEFIEKLIQNDAVLDKKIIYAELIDLLENKKINKNNTVFDPNNNIIKMGSYSL
jgi:hypothetical protein